MKPKIEEVEHSKMCGGEYFFVQAYYKTSDTLSQSNFFYQEFARLSKNKCTVGMWKIKILKNNYHAN